MKLPNFYPLSKWRSDVLVSTGVSDRFAEREIRAALQAHGSLRAKATTRVQVGHLGSVIVRSDPRRQLTLILRPDELRGLERSGRL